MGPDAELEEDAAARVARARSPLLPSRKPLRGGFAARGRYSRKTGGRHTAAGGFSCKKHQNHLKDFTTDGFERNIEANKMKKKSSVVFVLVTNLLC